MSVQLKGAEIQVDVVRLDSESIDEHLRTTAAMLCEILDGDNNANIEDSGDENDNSRVEDQSGFPCSRCGKSYKTTSSLGIHIRLKHPERKSTVRCKACNKNYASALSLQKHVRYMHQYKYRCQVCYRTFESLQALRQHSDICVKIETPCSTCGRIYDSPLSLRNHIKYKHPKEKTHLCNVCRRTFTSNRGLLNHMASLHPTGINCSQCNKKFKSVATLQSHFLDKHTEGAARCSLCRKVLASQGNLCRHLTKAHDISTIYSENKYWCGLCRSSYYSTTDLIQHVMLDCLPSHKNK